MHAGFNGKRWLALSPRTEKVAGSIPRGLEAFLCGVLRFLPVSCEEPNSKNALQSQHKTITDSNQGFFFLQICRVSILCPAVFPSTSLKWSHFRVFGTTLIFTLT